MPDVVEAGLLSTVQKALRTLLSNVTYFQTWTGVASAAEAVEHIVIGAMGFNIASYSISGNVVTLETVEPHNLDVADPIVIEGVSEDMDGAYSVASVTDAQLFTFAKVADDRETEELSRGVVLQSHYPFLAILRSDDDARGANVIASGGVSYAAGSIDIFVCGQCSADYRNDPRNAVVEMENHFGQFVDGLQALNGTGDYLLLNSITTVVAPEFLHTAQKTSNQSRYEKWQAVLRVTWGLEG